MRRRGRFIVFEGLDGSGKTTQLFNLRRKLLDENINCVEEREPSFNIIGIIAREAIKKRYSFDANTLALLFAADRAEHIKDDLLPALDSGISVLCDRFFFSNLAYQGLSIPFEKIIEINSPAIDRLFPDITIFIDTPPEVCDIRMKRGRVHSEIYDAISESSKIRENYFKAFEIYAGKADIRVINGNQDESVVLEEIWEVVRNFFSL